MAVTQYRDALDAFDVSLARASVTKTAFTKVKTTRHTTKQLKDNNEVSGLRDREVDCTRKLKELFGDEVVNTWGLESDRGDPNPPSVEENGADAAAIVAGMIG